MREIHESENDRIPSLKAFADAHIKFYETVLQDYRQLSIDLQFKAAQKPIVAPLRTRGNSASDTSTSSSSSSSSSAPAASSTPPPVVRRSAPPPPKSQNNIICRAKFDFVGEEKEELSFKTGDELIIHGKDSDDWYKGEFKGKNWHISSGLR